MKSLRNSVSNAKAWNHKLELVLQGANKAAAAFEDGKQVLIHCANGWDRTSQLVSLV